MEYKDVVSVDYQGIIVVFAREANQTDNQTLYYNVLELQVYSEGDALDWSGFKPFTFPQCTRPVGMNIVNVDAVTNSNLATADAPFYALSNNEYIYLFRQSTSNTLLVNRFRLTKTAEDDTGSAYQIQPVWEVRYEKSAKPDIPASDTDIQNYYSPEGNPFIEPTIELGMINNFSLGRFTTVLTPNSTSGTACWHFFIVNDSTNKIDQFSFPMDEHGLFDLTRKTLNASGIMEPDNSFELTDNGAALSLFAAPSAVLYMKQERLPTETSGNIMLQRNGRVMLAVPVEKESNKKTAIIDFAVAANGQLATVQATNALTAIDPANYTLEFEQHAYVGLQNTSGKLTIAGKFALEAWIYLKYPDLSTQLIIGGADTSANDCAPFMQLVEGSKIAVGFGSGSQVVVCQTAFSVITPSTWQKVRAEFDPSTDQFTILINDQATALDNGTSIETPAGSKSINRVSAEVNGFIGCIDEVRVYNGDDEAGHWSFDAVDYSQTPPTTEDTSGEGNTGLLYGPKLVPSTSPINVNTSGEMQLDANGLSIFTGLLEFAQPKSAPRLLNGTDGLVHCYFQNNDSDTVLTDGLAVAQYNAEAARASFNAAWDAVVTGDTNKNQTGSVQFVATKSGTYLNTATITIADAASSNAELCDITINDQNGTTETWLGVPRRLAQCIEIFQGRAANDPSDAEVQNGQKVFFDYRHQYHSCRIPLGAAENYLFLQCIGHLFATFPLKSVEINSVTATDCTVVIDLDPLKWSSSGDGSINTATFAQTWANVPIRGDQLVATLSGLSTSYNYDNPSYSTVKSYAITATTIARAEKVTFFTHPLVSVFAITVSDDSDGQLSYCNVSISATIDGTERQATWQKVTREQGQFAQILDGQDPDYDYETHASGDYALISNHLIISVSGVAATVMNHIPSAADAVSLLAGASTFLIFADGGSAQQSNVAAYGPVNAQLLQQGQSSQSGVLTRGSELFGVRTLTEPSNGALPIVRNTTDFTGGTANLMLPGINGGWIRQAPQMALAFDNSNHVEIDVTADPIEKLAIAGDMTVEAWCRPTPNLSNVDIYQRALTFNKTGNIDFPGLDFQYLIALKPSPCLRLTDQSSVTQGVSLADQNVSFEMWIKPQTWSNATVAALGTLNVFTPVMTLSASVYERIELKYGTSADVIQFDLPPELKYKWLHVAAVMTQNAEATQVTLALYVNGDWIGDHTYDVSASLTSLGAFSVGMPQGSGTGTLNNLSVNGAALWNRALTANEVRSVYEQAPPNNAFGLLIRWLCNDGDGDAIKNWAATGAIYDSTVANSGHAWPHDGIYQAPIMGVNDNLYLAAKNAMQPYWNHLALIYQAGCALKFRGNDFADCGNNANLNLDQNLSIEFWVQPQNLLGSNESILSKDGSYRAYFKETEQKLYIDFYTSVGQITLTSTSPFVKDTAYYIAVTFTTQQVEQSGSDGQLTPLYEVDTRLYIDSVLDISFTHDAYTDPVSLTQTDNHLNLARTSAGADYFTGALSQVRLWNRVLSSDEIFAAYQSHTSPQKREGLISYWAFDEMEGTLAYDQGASNNATLQTLSDNEPTSTNELWHFFATNSVVTLMVNGEVATDVEEVALADLGGYGDEQFSIGGVLNGDTEKTVNFTGELDEIRIWEQRQTAEQIQDNMQRSLTGTETKLASYWQFDQGSGVIVEDKTGRGNTGTLKPDGGEPQWVLSQAPLSNEAGQVYNVLGGIKTGFNATISETPANVEYADVQYDAYGRIFSVMKRSHALINQGQLTLVTGYKVGDLDTVYLGQAQTNATLMGYIEGPPPIPSENQTIPYWAGEIGNRLKCADCATVKLSETGETTMVFSDSHGTGRGDIDNRKIGAYVSTNTGTSVGLGAESSWQLTVVDTKTGYEEQSDSLQQNVSEMSHTIGTEKAYIDQFTSGGDWEDSEHLLNPTVGRRFIYDNVGYALVKSLTADVYSSQLQGNGAMIKMTMVPNLDIPEMSNIIDFPLNPRYVKMGTLDGKVGLENDPDYPDADQQRGSYFKPLEAASLQREIQKREAELEAYYQQFDVSAAELPKRVKDDDLQKYREDKLDAIPSYDWKKRIAKRNIVNTYVWTAGGGFRTEQTTLVDALGESYRGIYTMNFADGFHMDAGAAIVVGAYNELDILQSQTTEILSVKSKDQKSAFSLEATVDPEWYLKAPIVDGNNVSFTANSAPGKVDAYRYQSFYLMPSDNNFTTFYSTVVDPFWLETSAHPNAAALRQAQASDNGVWRVLHRVNYVSRIPPEFQSIPDMSNEPDVQTPANLAENTYIVRLVEGVIGDIDPTTVQIGDAVVEVLGESAASPGILGTLLPWWVAFLTETEDYTLPARKTYLTLREDLLSYMVGLYQSENRLSAG